MKIANRRENPRIEIKLRCHIASPAVGPDEAAYTENISRSGVLIGWPGVRASGKPSVGQVVTIEIELPANHGFGRKCIHCQGTVIRVVQPETDGPLMALRVNYMDFRSFHHKLRSVEIAQPVAGRMA